MKVLVTGASGFIGRFCVPLLLKVGHEVYAVGRGDRPSWLDKDAVWKKTNILDADDTGRLLFEVKAEALLNFAWYTEHGKYWKSTENLECLEASARLLRLFAQNGGRRFVGAGSCAEYDWNYGFLSEPTTPLTPGTPFGRIKNGTFQASSAFAECAEISFAWGRIFFIYGPHEKETRLVASVIKSLLDNKPALSSIGTQVRDFMHVEDVAAAFTALLLSDTEGAVNIASGEPVSVSQVIRKIGAITGKSELLKIGALPMRDNEPPFLVGDVRRLKGETGFAPKYDLDRGLDETIRFYRDVY